MKVTIIAVGKVKEKFYREALAEFTKRLSRYCKLEIWEVADEKTPDTASKKEEELILKKEGERILKLLKPDMQVYALTIQGESLSSEEFAQKIEDAGVQGTSWLCFIIGGSLGIDSEVQRKSHQQISFSAMTFPHQLMRVILLEQIYRAFRIIAKEPYHK